MIQTQNSPLQRSATSLENKVVLISGASQGLGLALAEQMASAGSRLALLSRREEALQAVQDSLIQSGVSSDRIAYYPVDVSEAGVVQDTITSVIKHLGQIDILINNAALCGPFQLFQEHRVEDISYQIDVNLKGPMYLIHAVLPHMIAQGQGDIININSIAGKQIYPYCSVYGATKFALDALTRCVSEEQRANNIRVVGIYPGRIDTPIWNGIEPHTPQDPEKMLSVTDVANAVLYALQQPREVEIRELLLAPSSCD